MREPTVIHWHGMIVPDAADGHRTMPCAVRGYAVEFTCATRLNVSLPPAYVCADRAQTYYGLGGLIVVREAANGLDYRSDTSSSSLCRTDASARTTSSSTSA
jgi:FtsP/CotA-like multicopper oxidase with cupredoxin domain